MYRSKYHAKKVKTDAGIFDSKAEYKRYLELKELEARGEIENLRRQVEYELLPSQKRYGKTVERPVKYKADFVYNYNGSVVVEDVKGVKTPEYVIKRKLMLFIHDILVKEVK